MKNVLFLVFYTCDYYSEYNYTTEFLLDMQPSHYSHLDAFSDANK